jgi:hypothetical protein
VIVKNAPSAADFFNEIGATPPLMCHACGGQVSPDCAGWQRRLYDQYLTFAIDPAQLRTATRRGVREFGGSCHPASDTSLE